MAEHPSPDGRHWVVDGMNVIGSRPDGWWRDRVGAQRRLVEQLAAAPWPPASRVTAVFDGRPWSDPPAPPADGGLEVLFAHGGRDAADRRIVEVVAAAVDPSAVVVVTSDRALAREVARLGAEVVGPRRLPAGRAVPAGDGRPSAPAAGDPGAAPVVAVDEGRLTAPALVVHGGAGTFQRLRSPGDSAALRAALRAAVEAGWEVLAGPGDPLDAVVAAVASLEATGLFNAGPGATPAADGTVETDAAVMDGRTGVAGAVCAARWPASPVSAARAVAATGGPSSGPVLLAGEGADLFARRAGLAPLGPGPSTGGGRAPLSGAGTVGAVALGASGHLAAATSTGGRPGQLPGRVGDSPVVGAGTWADDATVAVSATGAGEAFLVAGFAHLVDWHVRAGARLGDAVTTALAEVRRRGGAGGAVALAPDGRFLVAFDTPAMARAWRDGSGGAVALLPAEQDAW